MSRPASRVTVLAGAEWRSAEWKPEVLDELVDVGLRRSLCRALDQPPRQVRCEQLDEIELVLAQQAAAAEPDPRDVRRKQVRRVDLDEVVILARIDRHARDDADTETKP